MQKWNRSPIDTGLWQKCKMGDIRVPKDWWDISRDLLCCTILNEGPDTVYVDKLSEESSKKVYNILSTAIKKFDISTAAIHTVSIRIFQALFSTTDNRACE
jgi:hypothetical protein